MATCTKYREIVELRLTINIHGCILEAGERSSPFRGIGSGETYRLGKAADEKERSWILSSAQKEADQALQEARSRIEQEREQVQAQAREQMPQLAAALAQRLVNDRLSGEER